MAGRTDCFHAIVHNRVRSERELNDRQTFKARRSATLAERHRVTAPVGALMLFPPQTNSAILPQRQNRLADRFRRTGTS